MLVLTRKLGERIKIGEVWITLLDVGHKKARIGVEAPKETRITREAPVKKSEILEKGP